MTLNLCVLLLGVFFSFFFVFFYFFSFPDILFLVVGGIVILLRCRAICKRDPTSAVAPYGFFFSFFIFLLRYESHFASVIFPFFPFFLYGGSSFGVEVEFFTFHTVRCLFFFTVCLASDLFSHWPLVIME